MIPNETVSLIRDRIDIVEVIGECVELRRGGASFKGLCPFHQEKTPSFNVNPARQLFHCFGCGASGDVIDFVMTYEGRTFSETVALLGARVGVEVEEVREDARTRSARDREAAVRERLIEVMERVAAFYAEQLAGEAGSAAREYLEGRGITEQSRLDFGLGYAPEEWDGLQRNLGSLGVKLAEAEQVGLVVPKKSGSGHYARFRRRVIFPVHNAAGRVVALGGRALPGAPKDAPKYVNSPETPIFSKSRTLYGLHRAREALRHREQPILVEGNLDVVSMHAHGYRSAVAPMGTALTAEQVVLLRRFAGADATVVLLFDGDEAGRHAADRAHGVLAEGGLGARVALLPPSEDPDSFLRRHGPGDLDRIIARAEGLVEHLIKEAAQGAGDDAHSKATGIRSLGPVLAKVTDPLQQDLHRRQIAREFGVAEALVFRYLQDPAKRSPGAPGEERPTARRKAEGAVLGALLDHPELFPEAQGQGVLDLVVDADLRWVLDRLARVAAGTLPLEQLADGAPDDRIAQRVKARLVEQPLKDPEQARQAISQGLDRLRRLIERERSDRLRQEISQAERNGDKDRAVSLAQEKLQRRRATEVELGGASGR